MGKRWNMAGAEQKELERLLKDGLIGIKDKPSKIQTDHEIFSGFTAAVFRTHFNETKKTHFTRKFCIKV